MLITPSKQEFTLSSEGTELVTFNLPVCMMTSLGGTLSMFAVNGTTWLRMFHAYRKHSAADATPKGRIGPFWSFDQGRSANPKVASAVDTFFYGTLVLGCSLLYVHTRPPTQFDPREISD